MEFYTNISVKKSMKALMICWKKKGFIQTELTPVGRINLYSTEKWRYRIYGNKNEEHRILLRGEDAYAFNDANYPEVYFCREDVLKLYRDSATAE